MAEFDPSAYRGWSAAAQEEALERLRSAQAGHWRPFYCGKPGCDGKPHDEVEWKHARADQTPPQDPDWLLWLLLSGRGSGKTRAGAEYTHRMTNHVGRLALVAPTGPDGRDIMIEGESGLVTIAAPDRRPHYEPSKRRLTWPNGAVATLFTAEEPDRLRGPEHGFAWCDEACFYPLIVEVWDNLMFGLRLGRAPRVVVTTTPKPRKWLKEQIKDPATRLSRATTYDNLDNLAPVFAERIISRYEGTRLGRQEIHAEVLEDVEGALWTWELIEAARMPEVPDLDRIVVAVDPAGSTRKTADETGIIVVGRAGKDFYVLADRSGRMSPLGWATATQNAYDDFSADAVVPEVNYGGEMVVATLRSSGLDARVLPVRARRGKAIRAEPVVGLYEQGRVHHIGTFPALETQLTEWVPYEDPDSPDRLDALVYAITELDRGARPASISSPLRLVRGGPDAQSA